MTPFIDIIFDDYQKFLKVKESQNKKEFLDFKKNIKLKNVSFSFSKKSKKILSDINLSVKNGEFIGVIGKSGSGKTTFADLIMGLVEPTSGLVEIDNTPLSKLEIRTWQDKVGYVPQNIYLTNDSIKNNIAYGLRNEDIDNSKLQKAIDKAELQDFIEESDDGINTIIGEGGKRISGGQKQRIGIARALYHNPKILILDESTSSLDKNTEKKIFNTIHKFKGQITVIIISHDKSILEGSDHIYEIQNGKFKEN
jgi:ABC-type bacteriocin/lantibiotic exporter with double-glycine peptidase domain